MKLDVKITFNENSKIIGFFTPHKEIQKSKFIRKKTSIYEAVISI
jgi:hypothetical protein